jgi:carbonic anhydrase/acetyltransferase-like protein (isoleucine patch superfamily)
MAHLVPFEGVMPTVAPDVFLAPSAVLIGDVRVGAGASIWFGAVLRADLDHIQVGEHTSIQDNVVLHCSHDCPTIIGRCATIGHGAVLEGCRIGDGALVGMNAVVLTYADVGEGALVAAGSVVAEHAVIPRDSLAAGVPAVVKRPLTAEGRELVASGAAEYRSLVSRHRAAYADDAAA